MENKPDYRMVFDLIKNIKKRIIRPCNIHISIDGDCLCVLTTSKNKFTGVFVNSDISYPIKPGSDGFVVDESDIIDKLINRMIDRMNNLLSDRNQSCAHGKTKVAK